MLYISVSAAIHVDSDRAAFIFWLFSCKDKLITICTCTASHPLQATCLSRCIKRSFRPFATRAYYVPILKYEQQALPNADDFYGMPPSHALAQIATESPSALLAAVHHTGNLALTGSTPQVSITHACLTDSALVLCREACHVMRSSCNTHEQH